MNTPIRLAIIGTAGRKDDARKLAARPAFFLERMQAAALAIASRVGATHLVSGGAAWADHVAVLLFLQSPERFILELRLPAALDVHASTPAFVSNGSRGVSNPGGVLNYYHQSFAAVLQKDRPGWNPIQDLATAAAHSRADLSVSNGLFARNDVVAASADYALAMTFGDGALLKDGGTAHTMRQFLDRHGADRAFHLDLNSMRLCPKACVS